MRVEIKQIKYTPDQYDDKGELKTPAYHAVNLNIPNTPEMKELLLDVMLSGESEFEADFKPVQSVIPGLKDQVNELEDKGLVSVHKK